MTYKKAGSRKKRLACAQEIKCFFSLSYYKTSFLSVSHARASRFFRCAVSALIETAGGIQKGAQARFSLKPLFPRYLFGVYVMGWAVG